jgi:hypothetical protein
MHHTAQKEKKQCKNARKEWKSCIKRRKKEIKFQKNAKNYCKDPTRVI